MTLNNIQVLEDFYSKLEIDKIRYEAKIDEIDEQLESLAERIGYYTKSQGEGKQ